MLATKLRALLQREKGRDLFDLANGLQLFDSLDRHNLVQYFNQYLERVGARITRAEAEQRMLAKLRRPRFLDDMRPLLPAAVLNKLTDESARQAFLTVFNQLIALLSGDVWAKTEEYLTKYGML
jgi:hypothetical protein